MDNRIKRLRFDAGLTQQQLAESAGISQQQLQRIEAGAQEPRLCVAIKIADGLDADLDAVFPPVKKAARIAEAAFKKGQKADAKVLNEALAEAGMELDLWDRVLRCRLRNYPQAFDLPISEAEYERLRRRLGGADTPPAGFVHFTSRGYDVLLNTACLTCWEWTSDPPAGFRLVDGKPQWDPPAPEDPGEANNEVQVYIADGSTFTVAVEPDEREWGGADQIDEEGVAVVRMQYFCMEVETAGDGSPAGEMGVVSIPSAVSNDDDMCFNLRHIAMIRVPLWVVSPALQDAERDIDCGEDDEDDGVELTLVPTGDGK